MAIAAGMIRSTTAVMTTKTISNGSEPKFTLSMTSEVGRNCGEVAVVEVREELADHQEQEEQATEPSEGLGDCGDGLRHGVDRAGALAVGISGDEKQQHDQDDQAVHQGRVADQRARLRVSQRRARGKRKQRDHDEDADQPIARESQSPRLFGGCMCILLGRALPMVFAKPRLDDRAR